MDSQSTTTELNPYSSSFIARQASNLGIVGIGLSDVHERSRQEQRSTTSLEMPGIRVKPRLLHGWQQPPRLTADLVSNISGWYSRRALEATIAWKIGLVQPDGEFNCQSWAAAVLAVVAARGLIEDSRNAYVATF